MIYFTQSAMDSMVRVVDGSPVETGGILVGFSQPQIVIVGAGGPGENSIREVARFSNDPKEDYRILMEFRKSYGESVRSIGGFHKHPGCMIHTSSIDHTQALKILAQFNDDSPLLVGIFIQPSGAPEFFLYVISRANPNFERVAFEVVADDDAVVTEAQRLTPSMLQVKQQDFWNQEDFQSVQSVVGRERLKHDLEQLKESGWQAHVGRSRNLSISELSGKLPGSGECFVVAKRDHFEFKAELPREYPLNPPKFFMIDGTQFVDLHSLSQWSSSSSLLDAFTECYAIVLCQCCQRRHLPQPEKISWLLHGM